MPSLSYYLQRTKEQPFRETLNLAQQLLADRVRIVIQPAYDRLINSAPTKDDVLKRTGAVRWEELAANLKTRTTPRLFAWPILEASVGRQSPPREEGCPKGGVVERADTLLMGAPLHWHTDARSSYTWDPHVHYRRVPLSPKPGVDIKGPWDLSRFHEAVILGQAYQQTSDEKFAQEYVRRVLDWIAQNPYRHGVNWTSAMEAGIRAANWIVAFYLMRRAQAIDGQFIREFIPSLYLHAHFIKSNLEYREAWSDGRRKRLNSNHYLCNLAGLLFIAILFPELQLDRDRQFAAAELEREALEQTHPDGVDYEHSTTYHRFVLEIFTACFELMKVNGLDVSPAAEERLILMRRFLSACTHPDGTLPQIGDNDGGRFLPLALVDAAPDKESRAFPDAGFFSMRGHDTHVVVSASHVGMRGFGSHSHNDILSFEYWHGGHAWIVDPGTYVYLPDPESRNWFRSTEAHNAIRIDEAEINPFHPESIFQIVDKTRVQIDAWNAGETVDILEAHRLGPAQHRRRFELDKTSGRLEIKDVIAGTGTHLMEWFFQIHPSVSIQRESAAFILSSATKRLRVEIQGPGVEASITKGWYSATYGVREPANRIFALLHASLPQTVTTIIEPC